MEKPMRKLAIVLTIAAVALMCGAADWPQFQGPDRNGMSAETGLLKTWPAGGPKVLWRIELGAGYGPASIYQGEIFVLDRVGGSRTGSDKKDVLRCLELTTGKEKWTFEYPAPGTVPHPGSRMTPAVTDKHVFTLSPFGHLHCIDKARHKPVWEKQLLKLFGAPLPRWGIAQSPVLYKNLVIVAPLGTRAGLAAFEQATGKLVWKSPALGKAGYCSPQITTIGGVEQVLMLCTDSAVGVDVKTGKELWRYEGWSCKIPITSPTPVGDGRIFITGGYKAGSAMIKVTAAGGTFSVKELYKTDKIGSQTHQPLLIDGHFYANSNSNEWQHGMMCFDLDGRVLWQTGASPNFQRGNLIYADGLIYNLDGKTGHLRLVQPSPKGYKQIAEVQLLGGKEIWAPMSLSNGLLVIRDQSQMKCLDLRAK